KFIFIDITDTVWIIEKNQEPKIYQRQLYKTDEIFIYYDNKHIVGIDIVQPYFMNALVTINNFNKFTDVAQACFRMRNLNHGHHVNFVLLSEITINSKEELLKQLINNNQKHIDGQTELNKLLQFFKYIRRSKYKLEDKVKVDQIVNLYEDDFFSEYLYFAEG